VPYYAIYVPSRRGRRKRSPLEVYKLVDGAYILQPGDPVWIPPVGLALGRGRGSYLGRSREWLYWFTDQGERLLTPEEFAAIESQRAERLAAKLRELGVNPDEL
jgi:hypothetical protein